MTDRGTRTRNIALLAIALATLFGVYFGWRLFWFLTDDAFIAFRYVSNSRLGYGYVWNAPPFRPVEGYTSFLWVVLLDAVWRVSGVEPPAAANYLSLFFTYLTLLTGAMMVMKMRLSERLGGYRVVFLALVLIGVGTNRTFLAWSSSGLETAMFNFFLTLWIYCCLFAKRTPSNRRWVFGLMLTTALLYLTRPDGLLFAVVSVALVAGALWSTMREKTTAHERRWAAGKMALAAIPLLIIPAHLLWRRWVYGVWLPNTYYAKTIPGRIWPESGWRYLLSFLMEYSLWFWLALLVVVIVGGIRRRNAGMNAVSISPATVTVCGGVVAHFLYYTIVIGGDHFEYRVYSHLILLALVSFVWLLNALRLKARVALPLFALFLLLSWPIPWLHWSATHQLNDRRTTQHMRVSVTKAAQRTFPWTPGFVLSYLGAFDHLQSWLIGHAVCLRHQDHKVFYLFTKESLPSRAEGLSLPDSGYPVVVASSVGVISWVLPRTNVVDVLGLNDYVVARNPDLALPIAMAHERRPPPGYVECFAPNVSIRDGHFVIAQRDMTAERIVQCEQEYAYEVSKPVRKIEAPPVKNPIDEARVFVRQQYLDVLDREPDPDGLTYWSEQLAACPTGSYCFNDARVNIPIVFTDPNEFRETAGFVYRLNAVSFGGVPHFADFMRDRQLMASHNVDWGDRLEFGPVHRAFIDGWVQSSTFRSVYPDSMTAADFVNRLFDSGNLGSSQAERERLTNALQAGETRARVLSEIVEKDEFKVRIDSRALVPMQLLMLLRHDVNNDGTYRLWLDASRGTEPLNSRHFVCLILTSDEYQRRFGEVITHTSEECK